MWTAGQEEKSASIHWGYMENGAFTEFTDAASLDANAATMSLDVIFDGYLFSNAVYVKDGVEYALDSKILTKVTAAGGDTAWTAQAHIITGEGGSAETVTIEEGTDIYVYYVEKSSGYTPPQPAPQDVKGPITEKTVTDNEDGTFTIRLDITGQVDHTVNRIGANVIVVMDRTQSMSNSMSGGSTRIAAARTALNTLITTLNPGTGENQNLINFTAVEFANSANYTSGLSWTQTRSQMESYANNLDYISGNGGLGTCWQAGLYGGIVRAKEASTNEELNKNKTYIIFVTDGNPNGWYTGTNSDGGPSNRPNYTQQGAGTFIQAAYNAAIPNAVNAAANCDYHLYGVYCGGANDDGKGHLQDLMSETYNGSSVRGTFIDGTSTTAINDAFKSIAQTIVQDLGANQVTVDDGVPTLSNVSAAVSGPAGGFEYYITPKGGTETVWENAPSAGYSSSNGVTWDLTSAGVLADGTKYSLEFTVWPSQAAYDRIADLNNGLVDPMPSEEELLAEGITKNDSGVYYLLTNTHLNTNYTYKNTQYSDSPNVLPNAEMILPTETISVEKIWHNFLDSRSDTDIDGLQMVLSRDEDDYLEFDVSSPSWTKTGIYISVGQISSGEILETGHDYFVTEKAREDLDKTEYWEVNSPIYHPMIVDGDLTMFIRDDSASTAAFEYKGHKYVEPSDSTVATLSAINERVSWLNLTKVVNGKNAPADALFNYKVKITEPVKEGSNTEMSVFFSVFGDGVSYRDDIDTDATKWVNPADGKTYYYAANETEFWLKIKAGWNVRFLNVATDSTYSITEVEEEMDPGFVFESAKNVETFYSALNTPAAGYPITTTETQTSTNGAVVSGSTVTGKVNQTNTDYTVTYTNNYLGVFYVYHSSDNTVERYSMAENGVRVTDFDIYSLTAEGTLYGGYYSDYAGKSDSFDAAALDYSGENNPKDEGGTAYSYAYIKDSGRAAWTYSKGYNTSGKAMDPVTDEVYYLKEVPAAYILPYTQYTYTKADKVIKNMWFVSSIDDLCYQEAGFFVETIDANGKKTAEGYVDTLTVTTTGSVTTVTLSPKSVFGGKGIQAGYLTYWDASKKIAVDATSIFTPYWLTKDGMHICGTKTRTVKFKNGKVGSGGMRTADAENSTRLAEIK